MNIRNRKTYDLYRAGSVDSYGETPYADTLTDVEVNLVETGSNQATDEVSSRLMYFMGLTESKDLKVNDMLVNGSDKYVITSVNSSARLTQIQCTKQ